MSAFVPSSGPMASNHTGVRTSWRYRLGGGFIFVIFVIPLLFRFRSVHHAGKPGLTMLFLILLSGILAAMSSLWSGSAAFVAFPILSTIVFMVLQAVALRRVKISDSEMGRFLMSAAPPLLFAGTWILTGLWPLGIWAAVPAYLPAVLVSWKPGWGWRIFDIVLLLPIVLLTWLVAMCSWIMAPLHAFSPVKLPLFTAVYMTVLLIGTWVIFGRRVDSQLPHSTAPVEIS